MKANPGLKDPNKIAAGGKLVIPGAKSAAPAAPARPQQQAGAEPRPAQAGAPEKQQKTAPNLPAMARPTPSAMKMPDEVAGVNREKSAQRASASERGIRSSLPSGDVDMKFRYPGSAGDSRGRATEIPKEPPQATPPEQGAVPSSGQTMNFPAPRRETPAEKAEREYFTPKQVPSADQSRREAEAKKRTESPPEDQKNEQVMPPGFNRPPAKMPTPAFPGPEGHPATMDEPPKTITKEKDKEGQRVIQTIKPTNPLYESVTVGSNKYRIV